MQVRNELLLGRESLPEGVASSREISSLENSLFLSSHIEWRRLRRRRGWRWQSQRIKHVRLSPRWRLSLYYSAMRIADGSTTRFLCVILRGLGSIFHLLDNESASSKAIQPIKFSNQKERERERERERGTSHEQPMKSSRPPSASWNIQTVILHYIEPNFDTT